MLFHINRLQCSVTMAFIITANQNIVWFTLLCYFIVLIWNPIHNISKLCLPSHFLPFIFYDMDIIHFYLFFLWCSSFVEQVSNLCNCILSEETFLTYLGGLVSWRCIFCLFLCFLKIWECIFSFLVSLDIEF